MKKSSSNYLGFTLIELLVVVLIIGILAAIALPQYQNAVWRSRATELQTLVRSLATAQESFYMASGHFAQSFDELDISFNTFPNEIGAYVESQLPICAPGARTDGSKVLILNNCSTTSQSIVGFLEGPYAFNGFSIVNVEASGGGWRPVKGVLYCVGNDEKFCPKIMKGTLAGTYNSFKYYTM